LQPILKHPDPMFLPHCEKLFHTHRKQQANRVKCVLIFIVSDSEQKFLHRMITSIRWLHSALNFFMNLVF
jgi:hypothetical protein